MSQKIFDNDLVAISKSKLTLNFSKACWDVYIRLRKCWCLSSIMITSEINMVKTQNYYSLVLLFWCLKLKRKIYIKTLARIKKFAFCNYLAKSKYYDFSNKLVVGKMKDDMSGTAISEIVGLKLKMCSTAQKMKFSINNFFSKCDQIFKFQRIWSHFLRKSLIKNFIFSAVFVFGWW